MARCHVLTLLLVGLGLGAGCTNAPGAIELRIKPEKSVFHVGEPLRLNATVTARDGPVCLGRRINFLIELRKDDSAEVQFAGDRPFLFCGTGLMPPIPVALLLIAAAKVDVADCGGRFVVILKGGERAYSVYLASTEKEKLTLYTYRSGKAPPAGAVCSLPPGHYRLRADLLNLAALPPLFWTIYEQPISGKTEFDIEGSTADYEYGSR